MKTVTLAGRSFQIMDPHELPTGSVKEFFDTQFPPELLALYPEKLKEEDRLGQFNVFYTHLKRWGLEFHLVTLPALARKLALLFTDLTESDVEAFSVNACRDLYWGHLEYIVESLILTTTEEQRRAFKN